MNRLVDAWLDALAARPQPPISLLRIRACMDNHVRGRIGDVRLASLSRVHVLAIRDGVAAQGSRAMANQVVAYLRAALRWGEDARIIPEAPRWRVPRFRLGTRAHSLTDDQWARLLAALGDEGAGLHRIGRLALFALALTGCRKGEIAALRWEDVGDDGSLRLLRHKSSAQGGPKHVPGSLQLLHVLARAREATRAIAHAQPTPHLRSAILGSPYVFPSIARNGLGNTNGA